MGKETNELWNAVDQYVNESVARTDEALDAVAKANSDAGLPNIDVTPSQGKLLHVLALASGAKRVLEIGTLGGYSTIWLARALGRGGRVVTLEFEPKHADVARRNLKRAGVEKKVEIRVGAAADSLARLQEEGVKPFDLIFIDADKQNNAVYLDWALKLAKRGTVIVVDNVVREGALADAASTDPSIVGTRAMFERMGNEPRLSATAVQTVGSKGYDGFAIAVVVE
ncbi:MAG TPA: O-methyltransferase [Acidobacteriaceae bacterium]|jgi:predicted O-methyltransferase YrrM|nr:O-methyltransferase [Acidobacteriaceae bacterium]